MGAFSCSVWLTLIVGFLANTHPFGGENRRVTLTSPLRITQRTVCLKGDIHLICFLNFQRIQVTVRRDDRGLDSGWDCASAGGWGGQDGGSSAALACRACSYQNKVSTENLSTREFAGRGSDDVGGRRLSDELRG